MWMRPEWHWVLFQTTKNRLTLSSPTLLLLLFSCGLHTYIAVLGRLPTQLPIARYFSYKASDLSRQKKMVPFVLCSLFLATRPTIPIQIRILLSLSNVQHDTRIQSAYIYNNHLQWSFDFWPMSNLLDWHKTAEEMLVGNCSLGSRRASIPYLRTKDQGSFVGLTCCWMFDTSWASLVSKDKDAAEETAPKRDLLFLKKNTYNIYIEKSIEVN